MVYNMPRRSGEWARARESANLSEEMKREGWEVVYKHAQAVGGVGDQPESRQTCGRRMTGMREGGGGQAECSKETVKGQTL